MPVIYEFTPAEIEAAFDRAGGSCECCGKVLARSNSRASGGRGQWEAHHGSRSTPVILCTVISIVATTGTGAIPA
jgi:hypothetical protein